MRVHHSPVTVQATLWVAVVFGVLAVSRMLSLAIPSEFYFTFQSLFSDRPAQYLVLAMLGKMMAPLIVGFIAGWVLVTVARGRSASSRWSGLRRRLRGRWSPSVFLGGFFAAFLSAWPMILYWDLLANPEVVHLKPIFLFLYILYMLAYGYIALLGLLTAVFLREHTGHAGKGEALVSVGELSRVGALWLLNSGIASVALEVITG